MLVIRDSGIPLDLRIERINLEGFFCGIGAGGGFHSTVGDSEKIDEGE
jgi:hypothetical protein